MFKYLYDVMILCNYTVCMVLFAYHTNHAGGCQETPCFAAVCFLFKLCFDFLRRTMWQVRYDAPENWMVSRGSTTGVLWGPFWVEPYPMAFHVNVQKFIINSSSSPDMSRVPPEGRMCFT